MTNKLIVANNLTKSFGDTVAVDGLDLQVQAGEIYGLVGPDGAGKTTTLRLLCGALGPDEGEIDIAGYDVIRQTELARTHIGYLPQRFSLYEELTVIENLRFFAEVRGLKTEDWKPRCTEILQFVGLADFADRWAGKLSGGMKQKLGLAVALVHQPKVLLLDEPTTGVDPVTRQDFWQLIIRLAASGDVVVLVTTPYMDEASRCTRVGFMKNGRLLVEDTPDMLRKRLTDRVIEVRGEPLPLIRRLAAEDEDVEDAQMFGDRVHLRVKAGEVEQVSSRLESQIMINHGTMTHLRVIPPQLEDIFMELLALNTND
jgi:ABC-2 type transport system ATP-binding protein